MAGRTWDADGAAAAALRTVQADYGTAGLSNSQLMASMLKDLAPEAPREASVLVAAADADLARVLKDRADQGVPLATAVQQAAAVLEDRTGLAPEACRWAATAIGMALGMRADAAANGGRAATSSDETQPRGAQGAKLASLPVDAATIGPAGGQADGRPGASRQQPRADAAGHDTGRRLALVSAGASLLAALLLPVYVLAAPYSLGAPWSFMLALTGVAVTIAAALAIRPASRRFGLGALLGAATAAAASLAELDAIVWTFGWASHGSQRASALVLLAATFAAAVSAASAARGLGRSRQRISQLGAAVCLAGICFALVNIPAHLDWFNGADWLPFYSLFGSGVHGWESATGAAYLVLLPAPILLAVRFVADSGARTGVWAGWLLSSPSWLIAVSVSIADANSAGGVSDFDTNVRATPWLYLSWGAWLLVLALGAVMLARERAGRAVPAVLSVT